MYNFAFKKHFNSKENKAIAFSAITYPEKYQWGLFNCDKDVPQGYIPVGTVAWVQAILQFQPKPDYYPEFLRHLLFRKIWESETLPMKLNIFIKPADTPKRFSGKVKAGTDKDKMNGPYWCSDVVHFTNEWRYYIINGQIVYSGWYEGNDDDMDPPALECRIPEDWCGSIDMGILNSGEFALVECSEPYSCGWYGTFNEAEIYTKWIIAGYEYLIKMKYDQLFNRNGL